MKLRAGIAAALGVLMLTAASVRGASLPESGTPASAVPPPLEGIGIEQRLDQPLPLDVAFRDESGKSVRLGEFFGDRPVIVTLAYYHCPMLCPMVLDGVVRSLRPLSLALGADFRAVTVSIDPNETPEQAAAKKKRIVSEFGRDGAAEDWHFLVGDEAAVRALADAIGFHYRSDPANGQFAHAAGLFVATPQGKISRVLYGIDFAPRDVRLALVEASAGKVGTIADQLLLFCYHYDAATGRYGAAAMTSLRIAALVTVVGLVGFVTTQLRRERAAPRA
jgi:protein SCO1